MSAAPYPLSYYLGLITSEHNTKPKFMATVALEVQPFVDLQQTLYSMIGLFTPDSVGDQLDKVGAWVGVSRDLTTPLTDVWFSLDEENVGLDQGTLFAPGDNESIGLTSLPDDSYQLLIKLAIAMNYWDGTIPGAYSIWATVFASEGWSIIIQDFQDMSMAVLFLGGVTSVVMQALIVNGYFKLRPAGVRMVGYYVPTNSSEPVFGLDAENSLFSGLDVGYLATEL